MKKTIAISDGMGGGIGVQLIGRVKEIIDGETELIALGANAIAAERMVKAGAHRGAAGENAVKVSVRTADFILGPIGIVIADSMMGEISREMAEAVLSAPGVRILLPLQQEHFFIAGLESLPLAKMIDKAVELLKQVIRKEEEARGR
jgi:hypothetical protein